MLFKNIIVSLVMYDFGTCVLPNLYLRSTNSLLIIKLEVCYYLIVIGITITVCYFFLFLNNRKGE